MGMWLRRLRVLVCVLAIIGAGLVDDVAWAEADVGTQLETIVASLLATAPQSANHGGPADCPVQVACPVFVIVVADAQPEIWDRKSAEIPIGSKVRFGRTTSPASPPPKPVSQA